MEPTNLNQSAYYPTIRYSINELLEYRSSLSYVICPIDEFTLVAWAEGLLDKIGEYVPEELVARKQYAQQVTDMQEEAGGLLRAEITAKRKLEYAGLTFTDFLNLGKYGSPERRQMEFVPGSHPQEAQMTPSLVQVNPYIHPEEPKPENKTASISPIQEKNTHRQSTSGKETKMSNTGGETVESDPDGGVHAGSNVELAEIVPSMEAVEEPEESGDIVDQDAWIEAMLERTKAFVGNKYKRT